MINTFASNNPNYKPLATAQLTITDQTDASNLAGNMTVVSGSKNQIYLTGTSQAYSPDWKISNLVIKPFLIASAILRGQSSNKYNPDLFDPWEYPDLSNPGDVGVSSSYIRDIKWYIKDSAGSETLIDVENDNNYTHTWEYQRTVGENTEKKVITDSRQLVVKNNILNKDSNAAILIKFAFHDPFADIDIPQSYLIDLSCISTGMGTSKTNIISVNGNTFYNADPDKLLFIAEYYADGEKVDLQSILENSARQLSVKWYIRTQAKDGWALLDPVTQDDNSWNVPGEEKAYEIHRVDSYNETTGKYTTSKIKNPKGGIALLIYEGLIAGSDVIKLVITDDTLDGQSFSALEVIYDNTDPVRAYVHSSNGDKLYKGMTGIGTVLKPVITYNGELLSDGSVLYEGDKGIFSYYWYKIEADGNTVYNVWEEELGGVTTLKEKNTSDADYLPDNGFPKQSDRHLEVSPNNINNKATYTVDILDKVDIARYYARIELLEALITEEEIMEATYINQKNGMNKLDVNEVMTTAYELRNYNYAIDSYDELE